MFTLNCKGRLVTIDQPIVMGILNLTPDSFYKGSRVNSTDELLQQAERMIRDGATILDLGGQSSRPGAERISSEEELKRLLPAIESLQRAFPETILSVDTFYARTAKETVHAGASLINDISAGLYDEEMVATVTSLQVPFIAMHLRGTPATMQTQTNYEYVVSEVVDHLQERIRVCEEAGIKDLIIDPGFGFAKTTEQNFELLHSLDALGILQKPVLVGLSRKSMIYKTLGVVAEEALNGTSVLHTIALQKGVNILRTHDVKEAKECIQLWQAYQQAIKKGGLV